MNIAHVEAQHDSLVDAMDKLMEELNAQDLDMDGSISLEEFKKAFANVSSPFLIRFEASY